jgi:hypothetical protein
MAEQIIALFDSELNAMAAARNLENGGIPASAIRQHADVGTRSGEFGHLEARSTDTSDDNFWAWLFFDQAEKVGASTGNVILSVMVADASKTHDAIATIEALNPLEIALIGLAGASGDILSNLDQQPG